MTIHDAHLEQPERPTPVDAHWYALWTASHYERLVRDQLAARGFTVLLPEMQIWSQRRGTRHLIPMPMFPGYLFLRCGMSKESYIEVRKARGLVRILGDAWDRLAEVPDGEVDAIHRIHQANLPTLPHPFMQKGQRVRIMSGPLAGVEGALVKADASKGLLVVSVTLLQRAIAVQVDCTAISPIASPVPVRPQGVAP